MAAELKARKAPTIFEVAEPGSPDRERCRRATELAKIAARAPAVEIWDPTLPENTNLPGLSLQDNRQKVFYRSIREEKNLTLTTRPSTPKMLAVVRGAAEDAFGKYVSDSDIWRAVRTKDILPRTSQFIRKGLHNAHRIGTYWTHIPECEDCGICKDCNTLEDLEHILVKCQCAGRETIWRAAEKLWLEKESDWPEVSLGTILGCGLAEFHDESGKEKKGTRRLYRILMSESAYLIWRIRNDRVISRGGEPATEDEIVNRWKFAINQRLQVDKLSQREPPCTGTPTCH
jgi:ribonuclease HI